MSQAQEGPDRDPTAGTPRWVKVFGAVALLIVLLLIVAMLLGGEHGPGRHLSPAGLHPVPPARGMSPS
jgi:hypothetical protein